MPGFRDALGRSRAWRDPTTIALCAAALLHASIIATAPLFPRRAALNAPAAGPASTELYEVTSLEGARDPEAEVQGGDLSAPRDEPPSGSSSAAKTAPPKSTRGVGTVLPQPGEIVSDGSETEAEAGPPATFDGPPGEEYGPSEGPGSVLGVPGLGGPQVWSIPGVLQGLPAAPPAPAAAAPKAVPADIASRVLSGTLRKKDQELGLSLPSGGLVANAVVDAVRASDIPGDAKATFEVRLGPAGNVLGVRVASASAGNGTSWDRVARAAAAQLASKALAMRGSAAEKGATVTVRIDSKVVYPAGTKEMVDVQPVCAEEQLMALAEELNDLAGGDKGPIRDPAVSGEPGKAPVDAKKRVFCIPIGIAAQGDLSNLGARPTRVVHSSYDVKVEGEQALSDPKLVDTSAPWVRADPDKIKIPRKWKKKKLEKVDTGGKR